MAVLGGGLYVVAKSTDRWISTIERVPELEVLLRQQSELLAQNTKEHELFRNNVELALKERGELKTGQARLEAKLDALLTFAGMRPEDYANGRRKK